MTTPQDITRFMNDLDYQGRTARSGLRQGAFTRAVIVAVEDIKLRRVTVSVDIRRADQSDATISGVQIIGINEQAPPRVGQEVTIIRAGASGQWLGVEIPVDPTDILELFSEQALAAFVPGHDEQGAPVGVPDFTMRVWYDDAIESPGGMLPHVASLDRTAGLFLSDDESERRRGVGIEARGGGWSSDFTCTVSERTNEFPVLQNYAPLLEPQPLITYKVNGPLGLQVSPAALRKLSQVGFLTFILGEAAEDLKTPNRLIPPTLDEFALAYELSGEGDDVVTYGGRFRASAETVAVEVVRMGGLVQTRHLIPHDDMQSQLRVLTEIAYPVDPVADTEAMYYGSHIIGALLNHSLPGGFEIDTGSRREEVEGAPTYVVATAFSAIPVGAHHPVHTHVYPDHRHSYAAPRQGSSNIIRLNTGSSAALNPLRRLHTDVPSDLGVAARPARYVE